jgi:hypothetical protein
VGVIFSIGSIYYGMVGIMNKIINAMIVTLGLFISMGLFILAIVVITTYVPGPYVFGGLSFAGATFLVYDGMYGPSRKKRRM